MALAALVALAGCKHEDFVWREALTLTVATPDGAVAQTSVREVRTRFYTTPPFATNTQIERRSDGGPLILDLGEGKVVFGIATTSLAERTYLDLGGRYGAYQAFTSSPPPAPREIAFREVNGVPRMVFFRFRDLSDPQSIERVDINNLAATFGPGYALTSAIVSIVDPQSPMTPGRVHAYLPWLSGHEGLIEVARPGTYAGLYRDTLITGYLR